MAKRKRLVTTQTSAEKWLALEMTTVIAVKLIDGFRRENGGLLGPSAFVPILTTYGLLSILAMSDQLGELAVILGLLVLMAVLLRPDPASGDTAGRQVTRALANAAQNAAKNPKFAQPVKEG